jgi:hypothetical protein
VASTLIAVPFDAAAAKSHSCPSSARLVSASISARRSISGSSAARSASSLANLTGLDGPQR